MNRLDHSEWKSRYAALMTDVEDRLRALWRGYARDPARLRRLQDVVVMLLVGWSILSVSQLFWIPWRADAIASTPDAAINPPKFSGKAESASIDISAVLGSGLFGGDADDSATLSQDNGADGRRDGIEQNAQETRLALTLTGIVASTEDGLGSAVIKANNNERVYSVGDALPASGRVVLAKVMPQQVVIDNNGTYELIKLYDGPVLQISARATAGIELPGETVGEAPAPQRSNKVDAREQSVLATRYRQQLYTNPESLAGVVTISPMRVGDNIAGYQLRPGSDPEAFKQLGFQSGDVVTAVNGLALSDASNTVKLYQTMKDATEVALDIERDGGTVSLRIELGDPQR